jgi:hypothetical protein
VGVELVDEGEERTIRRPSAQPVGEGPVDFARATRLKADPFLVVMVAETQEILLEDPLPADGATDEGPRCQREIIIMGEAPIQPGFVVAAIGVRHEPGGLAAS